MRYDSLVNLPKWKRLGEVTNDTKTIILPDTLSNYNEILTVLTWGHASRTSVTIPIDLFINGGSHENVYYSGETFMFVSCKYINDTSIEIYSNMNGTYCELYIR